MNTPSLSLVVLFRAATAALTLTMGVAQAAEVRGRVYDAVTYDGLEGALVTLDALPADGTPEYSTSADLFGLYSLTNILAGSYRLLATQPGYTPGQEDEVLATDTKLARNFPLTRLPGDPERFRIMVEVSCVKSGLRLSGVNVVAYRFAGAADVTADATNKLFTDINGRAILFGAVSGYYSFVVNDPSNGSARTKWESYVSMRKSIHAPHLVLALLKPVPQTMTVKVRGFDPTMGTAGLSNQPLHDVYVELEGVDPADTNSVLLPPRVGTTDQNGEAQFTDLPAVAWRVTAKRFGYFPSTNTFLPDFSDTLPTIADVTNNIMPIPFSVAIDSEYLNPAMMTGLVVRVTGFTNSNTEGITRAATSILFDPPGPPPPIAATLVPGLIAGRYEVAITGLVESAAIKSGAFSTTGRFDVVFSGSKVLDVFPGMPTPVPMIVKPELATVRVRYHAADAMSEISVAGTNGVLTNRPAYARKMVDLLVFNESSVTNQLKPPFRMAMTDTDASGETVLKILPGVYGVAAPTQTEYFGDECRFHDATTGETLEHGWPFANNPDAAPFPMSPHHALGLRFSSGHEYELDLFARKKLYDVYGEVAVDPAELIRQRVIAVAGTESAVVPITDLTSGGVATLTTYPVTKPLTLPSLSVTNADPPAPNAQFLFEDVEPGTRSLSITHPRNTINAYTSGTNLSVLLPDYGPPGIVDPGDVANAAVGMFPLQTLRLKNGSGGAAFSATLKTTANDTVSVNYYRWITNAGGSYVLDTPDIQNPDFFVPDPSPSSLLYRYAGTGRFKMDARDWFLYFVLNPTNWFKAGFISTNTGYEFVFNAYSGGPSNNVITPLVESYGLTVRAESDADPSLSISGLTVSFLGGGAATTPFSSGAWTNGYVPVSVTPQTTWVWPGNYTITQPIAGEFLATVKMRRGMGVSGLVLDATNAVALTNARVQLLDRFGSLLQATNTATNGTYVFNALPLSQPVFLDMTAPGYVQSRVRLKPMESSPDVASTNLLVMLGQPKILTNTLDRYGMFLPRVSKAGDTGNYTDFNATDALTMKWHVLANEHKFALDIPEFDSASGGTRSAFAMLTDPINETWLVDARGFASDPYSTTSTNLLLPPTNNPTAIRSWLTDVRNGTFGNVFVRSVTGRMPEPLPGTNVEVQAMQPLWELPPGAFRPVFVTLTKRGSAAISELIYSGAETNKSLFGEPLPRWLAFTADLFGFAAGLQAASGMALNDYQLEQFLPEGRFKALPDFTADISTNNGYLNYNYGLAMSWEEGQDTPRSGFLLLAPRVFGLEFGAGAAFGLDGEARQFSLTASANVTGSTSNLAQLAPAGLSISNLTGSFTVAADTTVSQSYSNTKVSSLEIKNVVGGSLSGHVKVNAKPVTANLPYVGPALLALDESGGLKIFATINGGIGLVVTNRWRTDYPPSQFNGSVDPLQKLNYRRHFLGGAEDIGYTTGENSLSLCFRFGVGLEANVLHGRITGTADLALQGNPCGGLDALAITPTTNSFGLPITRVTGALNLAVAANVNMGGASFGKELLNVDLLPIDVQFGTETSFYFVEMQEIPNIQLVYSALAASYPPNGPGRVKNFYRPGATTPAVGGGAFGFTDIDPTNHLMTIRLVGMDCSQNEPVTVASAPAILSIATLRVASGQWLTAWSEISSNDIGNPFAASTVKYSLSESNCANWTAPTVVAVLPDSATDLRFVTSGSITGLVWQHSEEGTLSLQRAASGATWNGTSWSGATELISPRDMVDFDAVGSGGSATPPALLAWSDRSGTLQSLTWNGTTTTGPHTIGTNGSGALDLDVNALGQFHCAWNSTDGGMKLSRFDGVSSWTLLGTPANNVIASELQLAPLSDGGSNIWLLVWIDATDSKNQFYAFATDASATLKSAELVAFPDSGHYAGLNVQPDSGLTARIISRHTDTNNITDLREYRATASGIAPWLLNPGPAGNGLHFDLIASPDQTYRLQGSSNLVDWTDLHFFTATNSPVFLQDDSGLPRRYYRAVTP